MRITGMRENLEVDFILAHKPGTEVLAEVTQWWDCVDIRDSQTCEDTAAQDKQEGNTQVNPESGIFGRLGQLLVRESLDDAAKGQSLGQRRKGVE